MIGRSLVAVCALTALVLTSCASTPGAPITVTKQAPAAVRTVTVAPTASSTTRAHSSTPQGHPSSKVTTPADVTTEPPPAAAADSWTMPNMVGQILQDAQDKMQALTGNPLFYTASTDASGAGRMQVLDSNWQVCAQTPASGTKIDTDTPVSFAAVKLSESCP